MPRIQRNKKKRRDLHTQSLAAAHSPSPSLSVSHVIYALQYRVHDHEVKWWPAHSGCWAQLSHRYYAFAVTGRCLVAVSGLTGDDIEMCGRNSRDDGGMYAGSRREAQPDIVVSAARRERDAAACAWGSVQPSLAAALCTSLASARSSAWRTTTLRGL